MFLELILNKQSRHIKSHQTYLTLLDQEIRNQQTYRDEFSSTSKILFSYWDGTSFHIQRNTFVAVRTFFCLTTVCWCHWKTLRTSSSVKSFDIATSLPVKQPWTGRRRANNNGGWLSCVYAYDSEEFVKASPSKCRFVAALLWSVKTYGYVRLFQCVPSPCVYSQRCKGSPFFSSSSKHAWIHNGIPASISATGTFYKY